MINESMGLKTQKIVPAARRCKAYANVDHEEMCVVHIVKTYIAQCPEEGLKKLFSLRLLQAYKNN